MRAGELLAVDAGQTGIRLRLGPRGSVVERPGVVTDRAVLPQVAAAVREFLRETGASIGVVAVGLSGLTSEDDPRDLLDPLRDVGVREVLLAHDSVTGYLGALGLGHGVVVAAGTGVVTLATGIDGLGRVDGWGHVMGDAGSAYWIGQQALVGAMRAYDGRSPHTLLLDVLRERWPDPETAYIALQASPDRVAVVASFARRVDELADAGDDAAHEIRERAAQELVGSAATALRRAGAHEVPGTIALTGGVFRSEVLRRNVVGRLRDRFPLLEQALGGGSGIDGAALLGSVPTAHALAESIRHARVPSASRV